ncbi:hypothetical protein FQZ97_905000 [compost metagenome]
MALTPTAMKAGSMACKSAPALKGSSPDQTTKPWYSFSARSTAAIRPSQTSGLMACILVLMLAISTCSSSVQMRIASFSSIVLPAVSNFGPASPSSSSGKCWRWYTGSCSRPWNSPLPGFHEPCAVCTPPASATRPLNTHSGSGALESALPASMSSWIIFATSSQPASCQSSNGPCFMPKPQRMAWSTSRAVSAIWPKCTAA